MHRTTAIAFLGVLLAFPNVAPAADLKLAGTLSGEVRDPGGMAQMGAVVQLLNRYNRVVQKTLTTPDGRFHFDSLVPDIYGIRVSLASYVPAWRNNLDVRAGMGSFLTIRLANLFSSIELVYTAPGQTGLVSEDWKWALRGSTATRPVLRLAPQTPPWQAASSRNRPGRALFSSTSGVLRVSAGDGADGSLFGSEPDLGTAFALATSVMGSNQFRFSGNVGYASGPGAPTAGFRTRYTHASESTESPEVELTVRQMAARGRSSLMDGGRDMPAFRTMSLKVGDHMRFGDKVDLRYGTLMESVAYLERFNQLSPYARLHVDGARKGQFEMAYSQGAPALDLASGGGDGTAQDGLRGLAMFPRVSLRKNRARVQSNTVAEVGYRKDLGSLSVGGAVYSDSVRDATVTAAGSNSWIGSANLLPDLASESSIFNLGDMRTVGYMASATQEFAAGWTASVAGGSSGMLTAPTSASAAADLRRRLNTEYRGWAAVRLAGTLRSSGTRLAASYLWTPSGTLGPTHVYLTERWQPLTGLNFQFRQPLPSFGGLPGHLEMTADLRNLMAQGYVPVATPDGQILYLIHFPRAIRGGLSFIF
jgi:hypothetical protein